MPKDKSLSPRHPQLWLKRLRKEVESGVRYYLVGEYGDVTHRPHYHAALFGFRPGDHVNPGDIRRGKRCSCILCSSWTLGSVHVGDLTRQSAAYIAGYVTKRMTAHDDPRLNGRYPEFARMSLKPGIGAGAVGTIAEFTTSQTGAKYVAENGDVPKSIRVDGKIWPVGRYIAGKVRVHTGMDVKAPPESGKVREIEIRNELIQPGGRERREQRRRQDGHRAKVLVSISNSKKGVGQ